MVNSSKTPTGKSKKGQVAVRVDSGSVKACFPRSYCNKGQIKLATGISLVKGWESKASQLQRRLQIELEDGRLDDGQGNFDLGQYQEILKEYGLQAKLRLVKGEAVSSDQLPPKPQLSLIEAWDMYCEYAKHGLKESTHQRTFVATYKNFLESAIEATKSEDALKIRNWLVENRNINDVKKLISNLDNAYKLAMRNSLCNFNPFDGLKDSIVVKGAKGKNQKEIQVDSDVDVLDRTKAFTWSEALAVLDYVKVNTKFQHWHNYLKFKFITGVRTGEAIAFMFNDIKWINEEIVIRRNYDRITKKFYPTKTSRGDKELIRRFPMPKDGELWNLLKSITQGELNEVVFKSKTGKIILEPNFNTVWKGGNKNDGIITSLIKEKKISKYIKPYNTRHTFITHQIFDLGRDDKIVSAWCGHHEDVSEKHYQDISDRATQINPELPANQQSQQQSELDLLKEQLRKQQELIDKLLKNNE